MPTKRLATMLGVFYWILLDTKKKGALKGFKLELISYFEQLNASLLISRYSLINTWSIYELRQSQPRQKDPRKFQRHH